MHVVFRKWLECRRFSFSNGGTLGLCCGCTITLRLHCLLHVCAVVHCHMCCHGTYLLRYSFAFVVFFSTLALVLTFSFPHFLHPSLFLSLSLSLSLFLPPSFSLSFSIALSLSLFFLSLSFLTHSLSPSLFLSLSLALFTYCSFFPCPFFPHFVRYLYTSFFYSIPLYDQVFLD